MRNITEAENISLIMSLKMMLALMIMMMMMMMIMNVSDVKMSVWTVEKEKSQAPALCPSPAL